MFVFRVILAAVVLTATWVPLSAQSSPSENGTISVQVSAPVTASLSGLLVMTSLLVPDAVAAGHVVFFDTTNSQGKLQISNLPMGFYKVCVDSQYTVFVVSCRWSHPDFVRLTQQVPNATVKIMLTVGVPIEIRIDDPDQLLPSAAKPQNTSDIGLMVNTPSGDQPLKPWIQDAGGRNYRILAPPNVTASIKASAPQLNLEDQNGNNVDQTAPIANFAAGLAAPVAGADNTQFLRFTVRKKN